MVRSTSDEAPDTPHGWTILLYRGFAAQLDRLAAAADRARKKDPERFLENANAKLFAAVSRLIFDVVPSDPTRLEYRLGSSLGPEYRNWFRVRFSGRFRLFFRYESRARVIVFAWMNDATTLRQRGARTDPYAVFRAMLDRGDPPDDWNALIGASAPPRRTAR